MRTHTLRERFPKEVAEELVLLSPVSKARLLLDLGDEITEKIDGFPETLSATTMQWLKSLTTKEAIHTIQDLATLLINEV